MSPHSGNNPSQMCAALIAFPISSASARRNYVIEIKCEGGGWEEIMCWVGFTAQPARCADNLEAWLFIYSCCILFAFSILADWIEREMQIGLRRRRLGILTGRETSFVSRLTVLQSQNVLWQTFTQRTFFQMEKIISCLFLPLVWPFLGADMGNYKLTTLLISVEEESQKHKGKPGGMSFKQMGGNSVVVQPRGNSDGVQ